MIETGRTLLAIFYQSITGTDTYTLTEFGNSVNGSDTSTITGSGTYSEYMVVASSPTILSGSYGLGNSESEDALSGALSQSGSLGRYGC